MSPDDCVRCGHDRCGVLGCGVGSCHCPGRVTPPGGHVPAVEARRGDGGHRTYSGRCSCGFGSHGWTSKPAADNAVRPHLARVLRSLVST